MPYKNNSIKSLWDWIPNIADDGNMVSGLPYEVSLRDNIAAEVCIFFTNVPAFRNSILGVFKTLQALARVPAKFRS